MRQLRTIAVAIAILPAGPVIAGTPESYSISPLATWSCEFLNSATDCGFSLQAAAANRATNAGPGIDVPTAAVLTTVPGDSNIAGSGTNERADLSLGPSSSYCNQGQEEWWAHSVMFPPSYVMPPQSAGWNWGVVFDFHHTGSTGQPNFEIAAVPTGLELNVAGGANIVNLPTDPGYYSITLGAVTPNVWYNFMYHIKWSSGSDGLFQAWLNGQQVMNYSGPNLYVGESCYLKLANYHTPLGVTESVIHSRVVQGTTQLAVELPVSPPAVTVTVAPAAATVQAGGSQALAATVANTTNTSVTWQVDGVVGGNSTVGTISGAGVYSAPSAVPSPALVTVTAVSVADPTQSGAALVTITAVPPPPPPVGVSVAPGTASLQTGGSQSFTATVSNTTNTNVTWQVNGVAGGNSTVGTVSSAGAYTAPSAVPSPALVSVSAVSVADPTRSGAAQVTIAAAPPAPPPVGVSIAPGTASLQTGASQEFTATVTNTTNATVTWQVNGTTGGDATVGVISASGVYSAPSLVPSPATVSVTAVSAVDPTRSGSAQVTISAPSNAGPPDPPTPAGITGGGGGGGSVDSFTLLVCALALARAHRRRASGAA